MTETTHGSSPNYIFLEPCKRSISSIEVLTSSAYNNFDELLPDIPKKTQSSSVTSIKFNPKIHYNNRDDVTSAFYEARTNFQTESSKSLLLPQKLLQDIRKRKPFRPEPYTNTFKESIEEFTKEEMEDIDPYYKFHICENVKTSVESISTVAEETFAGYKYMLHKGITIRSAKGTVRGVKNRVREGIATFLHINTTGKNYKEKEAGKVVVYTTTIGIIRETYQACMKVKQILRTQLVKFEERDVFMNSEYQTEIKERMLCNNIFVPQVFVNGHHVGDTETIDKLNETGKLRRILEPFKSMDVSSTCSACGGYRLLPCQICKGSKKSVHRNHFTTEFVALKCMNCDEVGLVRCTSCS